jgi:hypothetical protein
MKTKLTKRNRRDPNQPEFFAIIWKLHRHPFRLRAGDVIRYENRLCRVVRVNDCAAVILVNRPVRQFITRFNGPVKFQPAPALVRIGCNSEVEILNRRVP